MAARHTRGNPTTSLSRLLAERRLFIRSTDHTRFVRLGAGSQLAMWAGLALLVGWTTTVTALVVVDSLGSSNVRALAERDLSVYRDRVESIEAERDRRAAEVAMADERLAELLSAIGAMQSDLLDGETDQLELEASLAAMQGTLARVQAERDTARTALLARSVSDGSEAATLAGLVTMMSDTLGEVAEERDRAALASEEAQRLVEELDLERQLVQERSDDALGQIEDALTVSVEPLHETFESIGLDLDNLAGGTGPGHLEALAVSTMGAALAGDPGPRAERILGRLDQLANYARAVERVPLAMPVEASFRYTSPFGPRWGRMHEGIDMAGPVGTPIYATAEGTVTFAGWQNGYGRIVIVRHAFGIETRYPHLNAIRVDVGQSVARGEQVGDMGSSGRSTGSHLHYEVRVNGEAVNPMDFIRAGQEIL